MQARQGRHSKQQYKRYRANTVTASSKASATGQPAQQLQPAPLSHRFDSRPWHLSTNEADHRINVHILINAQNAVIATRVPVGAVDDGRFPWGRRTCGAYVVELPCAYVTCVATKTAQYH